MPWPRTRLPRFNVLYILYSCRQVHFNLGLVQYVRLTIVKNFELYIVVPLCCSVLIPLYQPCASTRVWRVLLLLPVPAVVPSRSVSDGEFSS